MKNTEKIVQALRVDSGADVAALIAEDASSVTAKVVATTHIPLIREILIQFVREVHKASALVLRREERKRVTAELLAAQDRTLVLGANRKIKKAAAIVKKLANADPGKWDELLAELGEILTPVAPPRPPQGQR